MKNETKPGDLKPRAIAVLCSLRSGPGNDVYLFNAIGDSSKVETIRLIRDMRDDGLIARPVGARRWYLADAAVAWLEDHGMAVAHGARMSADVGAMAGERGVTSAKRRTRKQSADPDSLLGGSKIDIRSADGVWSPGSYARPSATPGLHWVWVDGKLWERPRSSIRLRRDDEQGGLR